MEYQQIEIAGYKITTDHNFMDDKHKLTPEVKDIIGTIRPEIEKGKDSTIKRLRKLCRKYPDVPQFKNYLSSTYKMRGNNYMANKVNEELLKEYPDYLYGKLTLTTKYIDEDNLEKVPDVLGKAMEIKQLYPEREVFHIDEVLAFNKVAVRYFIKIDKKETAERYFKTMEKLDYNHPHTNTASFEIMNYNMQRSSELIERENEQRRNVETTSYDKAIQTDKKPQFHHTEIEALYKYGLRIDHDIIKNLLALPRESLITDLEVVLQDCIKRYEYFSNENQKRGAWNEKKNNFALHALFLLAELKAEKALPAVLNLLRQGEELLDFWFSGHITETIWEVIYQIGQNRLTELKAFLKEPDNYTYARSSVSTALEQIVLNEPERKNEIVHWYREVFEFFITNRDDDRIIDTDLIGLMVWECIDISAVELIDTIEVLFEHELVSVAMVGTFNEVKKDISRTDRKIFKKEIFDIYSRYDHILGTWYSYQDDVDQTEGIDTKKSFWENSLNQSSLSSQTAESDEPTVGRNEPCPCGSGRKYKKCCMNR